MTHCNINAQKRHPSSKMADELPSVEELKKLKVVELKARLSSLGLQTSGKVEC